MTKLHTRNFILIHITGYMYFIKNIYTNVNLFGTKAFSFLQVLNNMLFYFICSVSLSLHYYNSYVGFFFISANSSVSSDSGKDGKPSLNGSGQGHSLQSSLSGLPNLTPSKTRKACKLRFNGFPNLLPTIKLIIFTVHVLYILCIGIFLKKRIHI